MALFPELKTMGPEQLYGGGNPTYNETSLGSQAPSALSSTGNLPSYLDESSILRRSQRLSAPGRRELSHGLEKALRGTRYQENPNVAGMLTEDALSGYGRGLSGVMGGAYDKAIDVERDETRFGFEERRLDMEQQRIGMEQDRYDDLSDAAKISGIAELAQLGIMGYDAYKSFVSGGGKVAPGLASLSKSAYESLASGVAPTSLAGPGAGNYLATSGSAHGFSTGVAGETVAPTYAELGTSLGATGAAGETGLASAIGPMGSLGVIGAAAMAPSILGPPLTSAMKSLSKALGMGGKEHASAPEYVDALLSGKDTTAYGDSVKNMTDRALNSTLSATIYGPTNVDGYVPPELSNALRNQDKQGMIDFLNSQNLPYEVTPERLMMALGDYGKFGGGLTSAQSEALYGDGGIIG